MATIRFKRGSATPAGLTLAEPAFDYANNKLFVGVTASSIWVGAEIDNSTSLGTSQIKIPTQFAVKSYIDNNIAGGAVSTINGLTGSVFIGTGTGLSLVAAGKGITLTNTGVQSLSINSGSGIQAATVNGTTGAITYTITNTGVTGIQAGTGISVSSATGFPTITNTGVQSLAGTSNQITVSGATGSVTLSLPSAVTMPGSLTVTGDLTVNGTTTYINSTVTEIADPIITLGWTGGVGVMPTDDNKDRGIAFKYNSGGGKTGFFGYDDSTGYFTFVPVAGITSEVVGGTVGTANFNGLISTSGTPLTLTGNNSYTASIVLTGSGSLLGNENIQLSAGTVSISNPSSISGNAGTLKLFSSDLGAAFGASLQPTVLEANRTFTFPDHTGTVVAPSDLGTSGYILKANGSTSQPTWINANAAGFTAYAAQEVVGGAAGNLLYQSAANVTSFVTNAGITGTVLTYNTATNLPTFANLNTAGFTAFAATNIGGGAAGSLPYNTANTATSFLSIGTSGFVLTSTGSAPQWSDLTGLTAGTAQTVTVASDVADTTCFVTFVNAGTNSNQAMKYNSSLTYNAVTNYLEANIDGGSY